jgi:hypothetical protein
MTLVDTAFANRVKPAQADLVNEGQTLPTMAGRRTEARAGPPDRRPMSRFCWRAHSMPMERTVAGYLAAALLAAVMFMVGPLAVSAWAVTLVPLKGQTPDQMAADQQQCASQATAQTGYNPSAPPPTTTAAQPQRGQRVAGAARGAAAGKVVSNVTKDSETDDAMGAGAKLGVMKGGAEQRQGRREQRQQTQQQQAQVQQQASAYNDALSACLQSRGYSFQ